MAGRESSGVSDAVPGNKRYKQNEALRATASVTTVLTRSVTTKVSNTVAITAVRKAYIAVQKCQPKNGSLDRNNLI